MVYRKGPKAIVMIVLPEEFISSPFYYIMELMFYLFYRVNEDPFSASNEKTKSLQQETFSRRIRWN